MTVFDNEAPRTSDRKKRFESVFEYLNRSAKRGSAAARSLIEDWVLQLPASERAEIRTRFRSKDNNKFYAAFQELFLHEFLRRQKCELQVHPDRAGSAKRPDFLVRSPDGIDFVLEACTVTNLASGPESDPRANRIRDYLQTLELDGYKLAIDELAAGNNDLRQEPLREHIVDAIAAQHKDSPSFSIPDYSTAGGWRIKLTAYDGQQFGSNDLPTVFQESWVRNWCGPMYPLRDALKKKAGKYGRFEMPYVITVNSFDVNLTERDFEETLFGLRPGITIAGMTKDWPLAFGAVRNHHVTDVSALCFSR